MNCKFEQRSPLKAPKGLGFKAGHNLTAGREAMKNWKGQFETATSFCKYVGGTADP